MPTLSRPEVDLLGGPDDGDHRRPGADGLEPTVHRRHRHRRLRDAAHPLQPAREAAHRLADGVLVQRPDADGERGDEHREVRRPGREERGAQRRLPGRHVPALRGHGLRLRLRPHRAVRRQQVAQRGRADGPRLQHGRLVRPHLQRSRPAHGQADREVHQEGARQAAVRGADQDQGRGDQPHLRGPHPEDPEVDAVEGRRRACSRTSAPSSSGRSRSRPAPSATAPGSARRPGRRRSRGRTSPTSAPCRSATWPTGSGRSTSRRWPRCSPGCSTCSTRSRRSGSATSRSTGRRERCPGERRSAPR